MTDLPPQTTPAPERGENLLSVVAAILLGLAATLTALSAYQAALRDGEVLDSFNQSARHLAEANRLDSAGDLVKSQDQQFFGQYVVLLQTPGQADVAEYLRSNNMRPELVNAVDWWIEDPDAVTAFDEDPDNPYVVEEHEAAEDLEARSAADYDEAVRLDRVGDQFELATVLLALTLFFAGIASLFRRRLLARGLLAVGTLALGAGVMTLLGALAAL